MPGWRAVTVLIPQRALLPPCALFGRAVERTDGRPSRVKSHGVEVLRTNWRRDDTCRLGAEQRHPSHMSRRLGSVRDQCTAVADVQAAVVAGPEPSESLDSCLGRRSAPGDEPPCGGGAAAGKLSSGCSCLILGPEPLFLLGPGSAQGRPWRTIRVPAHQPGLTDRGIRRSGKASPAGAAASA
jgi:hypothetical protein